MDKTDFEAALLFLEELVKHVNADRTFRVSVADISAKTGISDADCREIMFTAEGVTWDDFYPGPDYDQMPEGTIPVPAKYYTQGDLVLHGRLKRLSKLH